MKRVFNNLVILNFIPIIIGLLLLSFDSLRTIYLLVILPTLLLAINSNHSYYNKKGNFWPNILYMCIISLLWNGIDYFCNGLRYGSQFYSDGSTEVYYLLSVSLNLIIILTMGIVLKNSLQEKFNTKKY